MTTKDGSTSKLDSDPSSPRGGVSSGATPLGRHSNARSSTNSNRGAAGQRASAPGTAQTGVLDYARRPPGKQSYARRSNASSRADSASAVGSPVRDSVSFSLPEDNVPAVAVGTASSPRGTTDPADVVPVGSGGEPRGALAGAAVAAPVPGFDFDAELRQEMDRFSDEDDADLLNFGASVGDRGRRCRSATIAFPCRLCGGESLKVTCTSRPLQSRLRTIGSQRSRGRPSPSLLQIRLHPLEPRPTAMAAAAAAVATQHTTLRSFHRVGN